MMASSSGFLSYHLTRLSISLQRIGHNVIVLSGSKEQINGLSMELSASDIDQFVSDSIDKTGVHDIYESEKEIQKIIETNDVDVVHAQGATHSLGAYLAVKSLPSTKRPSILTSVHSTPWRGSLQIPKLLLMTKILNMCSDAILPVSDFTKEVLVKYGLNPKKTMTTHNGLDLNEFDNAAQKAKMNLGTTQSNVPVVVCVANLIQVKGLEYYLMAAADVLKKNPAKFYVVGNGPQRKYLEKLACNLQIEKNVVFTGRIQWPEIYFFLSRVADICVSSSISENFPFYILECMAAKKPIASTNVGGVPEAVIDGVSGYLVPPRDPKSLANAILRLINNPETAREMSASARRLVEQRFSIEILSKKLGDIYEFTQKK